MYQYENEQSLPVFNLDQFVDSWLYEQQYYASIAED